MKTLSIAREYQQRDINKIQDIIGRDPEGSLVYQLPTGGGKTFMFCELARHYIRQYHRRVVILTHRRELCRQTVKMLELADIPTQVIEADSEVSLQTNAYCTVAMVETLNNRLSLEEPLLEGGLLIIDEAHNNSFQKLFQHFPNWFRLGFTATPLSSDAAFPLNKTYSELLIGETVNALIEQKFLAKPRLFSYDVDIAALERGTGGDFTTSSSDTLYGLDSMLALLLESYTKHSKGKKTLIFNNGIITSKKVAAYFSAAGITIRHLDNTASDSERSETLKWFRNTKDAILTSVSLFTTGFDEPGIQTVILNRATTSITLYYQMIGRGARYMDRKRTFTIIDLGNNTDRFGHWDAPVDWEFVFREPEAFTASINAINVHALSGGLSTAARQLFPNTLVTGFDMVESFGTMQNAKKVLQASIRQHAQMCLENASSRTEALELVAALQPDVEHRVKDYVKLLGKATKSYREWLMEDYNRRLEGMVKRLAPVAKVA